MNVLETAVTVLPGVLAAGGAVWWIGQHRHPDLVTRQEIQPLLDVLLQEVRDLRTRIDALLLDRPR